MRLRKNIRTPVRFEDEAVTFDIPKKKQLTMPAFPEKMAEQVVHYDKDVTPAAFPSLPLNHNAPSRIPANEPSDESESESDTGDSEDADQHELTCIGEDADITWNSLELAVQHRIWTKLRRTHPQEYAAALLQLSETEVYDIRLAVEKRRQCPIDSSRILATIDAVDDCDGNILAQFTPYILIAQSYELAFPDQVERGRRYLRKFQLEGAEFYVGAWWPDPEGSGYLKCVRDAYNNPSPETTLTPTSKYPLTADQEHALQAGVVAVPGAAPDSNSLASKPNAPLSDTEYRESMQAKAAQLRLSRAAGTLVSQIVPQKRPSQTNDSDAGPKDLVQSGKKKPETNIARRPVVIKAGRDPEEASSKIIVAAPSIGPITPVRNEQTRASVNAGGVDQMTPQVASQPPGPTSNAATPAGDRSSGSMSLRSRNSLRESQAMASMKQQAPLWEGGLDEVFTGESDNDTTGTLRSETSESEDDSIGMPRTPEQKVVSIRIDKKNALASIFRGEQKIRAGGYPGREGHLVSNKVSNIQKPDHSNGITKPVANVADEPRLFAIHMGWSNFLRAERQRLLSKPIKERNLVEMWLIYGTNAWKPESPWNLGRSIPMFKQPALGASLNRDEASSVLGRTLVDEWNRFQSHGVGQHLFEETYVGSIMVNFYAKMLEIEQMRQNLLRDGQTLEESGHVSRDQDRIDPHRRYYEEVRHWTRQAMIDLDGEYARRFQKLGKPMSSVQFGTPTTARVVSMSHDQALGLDHIPVDTSPALKQTPEKPTRKASFNNFAMKLIETPSTGAGRATTPPEDGLGIFGADDVGLPLGSQRAGFTVDDAAPPTPSRNDKSRSFPIQKDISLSDKGLMKTQSISDANSETATGIENRDAKFEDITMIDAPPIGDDAAAEESVTVASTPKKQKKSPRRPSWSPISDNEEFHSATSTPMLSHGQHLEESTPRPIYTPGRLTLLLKAAVSETTAPNSEVGELVADAQDVGGPTKLRVKGNLQEPSHIEKSVIPSVENDEPAQQKEQVGKSRTTPKLKLTLKQPIMLESTVPESPKNSVAATAKQNNSKRSISASKDAAPAAEVSSMVTRSMTATPVPGEMLPPVSTSTKKRKATPKAKSTSKSTKKTTAANSATPVHAQVEAIKREDAVNTPGTKDNAKAAAGPGPKKAKTKSSPAKPTTPRRPRGPYKKTREEMERVEAEKKAKGRAGENGIANMDVEGAVEDVEMTG